jgi:hypothetical protein
MQLLEELGKLSYKQDVFKMQQELLDQGWDDVELRYSKSNKENIELVVKKEGCYNIVLTALHSFVTMWSSRDHAATSAANMLNTMQIKFGHRIAYVRERERERKER